jgi:cellulose synthase/poly-beta-1,6-N-acetylglucosamine synthase-like glycosyltransferase
VLLCLSAASVLMLFWIYDGYGRCLRLLCLLQHRSAAGDIGAVEDSALPSVTVLLTVHNEQAAVRSRIENVLACDYPKDRLTLLVASDGSTDETAAIVREMAKRDARVQLLESPGLGKTGTQNLAITRIDSEIIVFTDADAEFRPDWLRRVAPRFLDPTVGAVDGRLTRQVAASGSIQASEGRYWIYEMQLRRLESQLGILAVVSGAAFALRRAAFVPMDSAIGEDCVVPLDVVSQGLRVEHLPEAAAFEGLPEDLTVTLRRRVRMTLRNWQGTWSRPALLNPLRHPGYAFALWSHKLLRWLSPVFMIIAFASAALRSAISPGVLSFALLTPWLTLFLLAGIHVVSRGKRIVPGAGFAWSFLLVNCAFLLGVAQAVRGQRIRRYR